MMWAEAVTAISVAVIAVFAVIAAIAGTMLMLEIRRAVPDLRKLVDHLDRDTRPLLDSAKTLVDDAGKAVNAVKSEVDQFAKTSRGLRTRVERAVDAAEDRLQDLDALLDVVQEEVEDAALDIAAALRTTRRGGKLVRTMKRKLLGRRR
jgi:uncharacterized protein YoxC